MTANLKLTFGQVVELVSSYRHSSNLNPNVGTGNCVYVDQTTGEHCLIGQILSDAGLSDEELSTHDNNSVGGLFNYSTGASELPYWADTDAADLAEDLQYVADNGDTWGEAVLYIFRERGIV